MDKHERAMYACLCGHLVELLAVCRSWRDYIWAYYKILVDQRVEQHIRLNSRSNRAPEPLPAEFNSTM